MNAVPAPLHGLPGKWGLALFLGILVVIWCAATIWCALSCLKEGMTWLWMQRRRLRWIFGQQKEGET